ncbi:hypothetical protein TSTA_106960 [Talaromyces stipitatus ATCC 10500]|uniref:Uncharacterized protein n=1 Tax=Talaromyces stipitatus (strain ATCC 10500 / CBS 375.48 / QM 6759 / NRRL 1006) TaxID=441959 RepID=B8MPP9_TALSN|nr:uncharacterized protein TSTA_106960 [Talaromyces stipitatus ATCC 10500]EED14488.1 hypothetical protein TSTA_106960 [Talaromyces stipitatus ATCC 10500]
MSAGAIIQQFSNLLKHAESLGPKLSSNIRPRKDQLKEIQILCMKLKEVTASIEGHVEHLLQKAAPSDKVLELLDRLRSSEPVDLLDPLLTTMLRKNLILIFRGPDVSALDSDKVRSRREKTRARCEKLRTQNPHLILRWSITFQPSTWNQPTVMTENAVDFLIDEMKMEKLGQISSQLVDILQCLAQEEPLKSCELFQQFVQQTINTMSTREEPNTAAPLQVMTAEQQQQNVVPPKRKHTAESMTPGESSHEDDTQEKIKLIKRSDGSSMPAGNLPLLIQRLPAAMGSSKQWKWERQLFANNAIRSGSIGVDRTDCLSAFVPKDRNHDVSITLMVGYEAGVALIDDMGAQIIRV